MKYSPGSSCSHRPPTVGVVSVVVAVAVAFAFAACLHFVFCLPLFSACLLAFSERVSKKYEVTKTKQAQQRQQQQQQQQRIEGDGNKIIKYMAKQMTVCGWILSIIVSFATSSFCFFECIAVVLQGEQ